MNRTSLYRTLCIVAGIALLLAVGVVIVAPFIPAILLAVIFALSAWPAFSWLETQLEHRRTLAAALMTVLLALCFILPLLFIGNNLTDNFSRFNAGLMQTLQDRPEQPPEWLGAVPYAGEHIRQMWTRYVVDETGLTEALKSYAGPVSQSLLKAGASIGRGALDLSLGVLISFFFFRHGIEAAGRLTVLIDKFFGPKGRHLLAISKGTMISVVYGMLGTALAQGLLAGIGFWIAGVPGPAFLALVTFIAAFVPFGPPLIWIPAALWLFAQGHNGMGIFMLVWGALAVSSIDNVIRPYFISLGNKMPLLLVLLGVLGGIIAFGFIGLFIGPTVLAVIYALAMEWSAEKKAATPENVNAKESAALKS